MKYTEAHIAHLILTYHEGTLSPAEKAELEALVLENPELALDLEAQPSLISQPIQIDSSSFLHPLLEDLTIYKDEEGHPLEKLAIGALEGQLSKHEQKIAQAYTQDAHYQKIEKEDRAETTGFNYYHIFSKSINSIGFEAVILDVEPNCKREKVITDAWEFKYIIKGSVTYIIDDAEVVVNEGDSLCFNGRHPHVPQNRTTENCVMLVLYFYSESNS